MKYTLNLEAEHEDKDLLEKHLKLGKILSFLEDWENVMRNHAKYGDGSKVHWQEVRDSYYRLRRESFDGDPLG